MRTENQTPVNAYRTARTENEIDSCIYVNTVIHVLKIEYQNWKPCTIPSARTENKNISLHKMIVIFSKSENWNFTFSMNMYLINMHETPLNFSVSFRTKKTYLGKTAHAHVTPIL